MRWSLYLLRAVDARANLLRVDAVLEEAALDKYSFTRDAHLQRRGAEVFENKRRMRRRRDRVRPTARACRKTGRSRRWKRADVPAPATGEVVAPCCNAPARAGTGAGARFER